MKTRPYILLLCAIAALLSRPLCAFAKPFEYSEQKVTFRIDTLSQSNESITISTPDKVEVETFLIENPSRLVVDLLRVSGRYSRSGKIKGTFVTGFRFGSHPDKVRLVFDLSGEVLPAISSTQEANITSIVLKKLGAIETQPQAVATIVPSPTPIRVVTSAPPQTSADIDISPPTASATVTETPVPTIVVTAPPIATEIQPNALPLEILETLEPSPQATSIALPTPKKTLKNDLAINLGLGSQRIASISFDYMGAEKSPAVKISLNEKVGFKFSKKDEKTFAIIVPDSRLATAALTLPNFPPQDFQGLTYVIAKPLGSDIEISVGVERGIRLSAVAVDSDIIVRAVNR